MNTAAFFQNLFGDDAPGSLVLFVLPGEIALWNEAGALQGAVQQVARFLPSHNIYFGVSLQDRRAAETEWRRRNPNMKGGPTTRGYSSTASAIPGVWADFDVQSPVHKASNLPPTKAAAQQMLAAEFPLEPSLLWDSGYGLQGFWLFRELWIFDSAEERQQAQIFVRRFIATLNQLAKAHGWRIDPTSDLARVLRLPGSWNRKQEPPLPVTIVSNKPEIRYNPSDFEPYLVDLPAPKPSIPCDSRKISHDLKKARAALPHIPSDAYDIWLKVGMALHSAESETAGLSVWEDWSRTCPEKFDAEVYHRKWESFSAERSTVVTMGTLFALAKENGWIPVKDEPPFPGDEEAPPEMRAYVNGLNRSQNGHAPSASLADEEENQRTIEQERSIEEESPEDPAALTLPPEILWQGVFKTIAEKLNLRTWEVWTGTYAALCARAHRNLHFFYHSDHLYGFNNCLLINRTGAGKNIIVNIVRSLLGDDYTIRTGIQSGPALIPLLTDDDLKNKTGRLVVWGRPVILICSEWSRLTAVAGIEHSTVIEDLNDLHMRHHPWTFARSHKNSSGGDIVVMNPALTLVGTTTNKLFHAALTDRMIASGYVNRYLIMPGSAEFEPYTGRSHRTENLSGMIDHLKAYAWGLGGELGEFYTPAAWKAFLAFQDEFILPLQRDPETSQTLSRLHLHLHQAAALYAWQAQSAQIELPHFEAARAIIKKSHTFVLQLLEERLQTYEPTQVQAVEAAMEQRAIAKLKQHPKLTKRELARRASQNKGGYAAWIKVIEQLLKVGVLFVKRKGKREELHLAAGH